MRTGGAERSRARPQRCVQDFFAVTMRGMRAYLRGLGKHCAEFRFDGAAAQFFEVRDGQPLRWQRGFSRKTAEQLADTLPWLYHAAFRLVRLPVIACHGAISVVWQCGCLHRARV